MKSSIDLIDRICEEVKEQVNPPVSIAMPVKMHNVYLDASYQQSMVLLTQHERDNGLI